MFYEFPHDLTLDEVTAVVAEHNANLGCVAFMRCDKPGYVVFNYFISFDGTFPPFENADTPEQRRKKAILRECRGLTFSPSTGKVLARKYHKFFNVNQKPETQAGLLDFNHPHVILEKLDGSMITPFRPDGSDMIRWGTKMGLTDVAAPVEEFVARNPQYDRMAHDAERLGLTLVFEWCSRKQRIVIDYPEDQLVLTAIRENDTGAYLERDKVIWIASMFGVPFVGAREGSVENIDEMIAQTADLINEEGYVIRFDNGHMVKLKAREYCLIHGTKDELSSEKNVLQLIFGDKIDDVIPFMDKDDKDRVNLFQAELESAIAKTADDLLQRTSEAVIMCAGSKKSFALGQAQQLDATTRGFVFTLWESQNAGAAVSMVKAAIRTRLGSSTRIDEVRHLFGGLRWDAYRDTSIVLDD